MSSNPCQGINCQSTTTTFHYCATNSALNADGWYCDSCSKQSEHKTLICMQPGCTSEEIVPRSIPEHSFMCAQHRFGRRNVVVPIQFKVANLQDGFSVFGNKGNVWADKCHIMENGHHPETLCGVPMLSHNYAQEQQVEHIGCAQCLSTYLRQIATPIILEGYNNDL